ncbi:MAG: hypothetical protein K9N51_04465 [Candidatus Pacebacteria bacterium]|nr:hypothetical protein [Candidatus Paceibacterota bacterium]
MKRLIPIVFFVLTLAATAQGRDPSLCVLDETFDRFQAGEPFLPQAEYWNEDADAVRLEEHEVLVVRKTETKDDKFVQVRIRGSADASSRGRPWTSYSLHFNLSRAVKEKRIDLPERGAFELSLDLDPGWRGAYQGYGLSIVLRSKKGEVMSLAYGGSGRFSLNGMDTGVPYPGNWHRVTLVSDAEQMVHFFVNGKETRAAVATQRDFRPSELTRIECVAKITGRSGRKTMQTGIDNVEFKLREVESSQVPSFKKLRIIGAGDVYTLSPEQRIFSDTSTKWSKISAELAGAAVYRQTLGDREEVVIEADVDGRLLAIPWIWDYGFYRHLPLGKGRVADGFRFLKEGVVELNGGYYPLDLYGVDLKKGTHRMVLSGYWGQWIVVGFQPGHSVEAQVLRTRIKGGLTRHNVFLPGRQATLEVDPEYAPVNLVLYHRGKREHGLMTVQDSEGTVTFHVPENQGRYALLVRSASEPTQTSTLPLTVGYPPVTEPPAPGEDFFPIQFWGGWGYAGQLILHPELTSDLQQMALFELGANTFGTGHGKSELVDALNGKRVVGAGKQGHMAFYRREHTLEQAKQQLRVHLLERWEWPPNVIGWMIVDEPGLGNEWRCKRLAALEELSRREYPNRHLVYCLVGGSRVEHAENWLELGSSIRQARIYPIRRNKDVSETIRSYATTIAAWQRGGSQAPLWLVMQIFGDRGETLSLWHAPTPEQVTLMGHLALARGVKGFNYFCYGSDRSGPERLNAIAEYPFVPTDGRYEAVRKLNRFIQQHESLLVGLKWQGNVRNETPITEVDVQQLIGIDNTTYLWVTNMDWENTCRARVRPILSEAPTRRLLQDVDSGHLTETAEDGSFAVHLPPGQGVLYRMIRD